MALIKCEDCGKDVSDKAASCPNCGAPIASKKDDVMIRFPVWKGQMFSNKCYVYNSDTNEEIACGKQGETVYFKCNEPMNIYVVVKGSFGKPGATVNPGDRYDVGYRGFGKIYLSKVDTISGNANSDGLDVSVGVFKGF